MPGPWAETGLDLTFLWFKLLLTLHTCVKDDGLKLDGTRLRTWFIYINRIKQLRQRQLFFLTSFTYHYSKARSLRDSWKMDIMLTIYNLWYWSVVMSIVLSLSYQVAILFVYCVPSSALGSFLITTTLKCFVCLVFLNWQIASERALGTRCPTSRRQLYLTSSKRKLLSWWRNWEPSKVSDLWIVGTLWLHLSFSLGVI